MDGLGVLRAPRAQHLRRLAGEGCEQDLAIDMFGEMARQRGLARACIAEQAEHRRAAFLEPFRDRLQRGILLGGELHALGSSGFAPPPPDCCARDADRRTKPEARRTLSPSSGTPLRPPVQMKTAGRLRTRRSHKVSVATGEVRIRTPPSSRRRLQQPWQGRGPPRRPSARTWHVRSGAGPPPVPSSRQPT